MCLEWKKKVYKNGFRFRDREKRANTEMALILYTHAHTHVIVAKKFLRHGATFDINSVTRSSDSANVSFTLKPYDDYFMVGVEGVEKAVCDQAAGTELPVSFQRRVYCDEGAMEFYFANDMGACDDAEKCALPEVCMEDQNQCGRLCCESDETCMPGRCCPKVKYITANYNYDGTGDVCCGGDQVAVAVGETGKYSCKKTLHRI